MKANPATVSGAWNEGSLRDAAFISPSGSNRRLIGDRCHAILEDLLEWSSDSLSARVLPAGLEVDLEPRCLVEEPCSFEEIRAVVKDILRQSLNPNNPRFMGHMDSMPTVWSILGDLLASGMNNNLFALEMSPVLTRIENHLVEEFCALFGLPAGSGGVVIDGGSLANLQALTVARNARLGGRDGGLGKNAGRLVLFCSADAHVSIDKAAMILGVGRGQVRRVETDRRGRMDAARLGDAVALSLEQGLRPFAVVSTAGTTVTGSVDPIEAIGRMAREYGVWHHVDAIWGGGLAFTEGEPRSLLEGIERADSITFNPQKWMTVAKTCSLALFRRAQDLEDYLRVEKTYVREQDQAVDLSEIGIYGTKRASCLKLFLSVRSLGVSGYRSFVAHTLRMTRYFRQRVSSLSYLEVAAEPDTAMVCMRGVPGEASPEAVDAWNAGLQSYLWEKKNVFFSLPTYRGRKWLRIVLLNPYMTRGILDEVFSSIEEYHAQARS